MVDPLENLVLVCITRTGQRIRVQDASSAFLLTNAPTRESGSGDTMSRGMGFSSIPSRFKRSKTLISHIDDLVYQGIENWNGERTVYYANSTIGALFLNRGLVGERRIVPRFGF